MSKLFRDWYEKCTADYDSLSKEEKAEFQTWVEEQGQDEPDHEGENDGEYSNV